MPKKGFETVQKHVTVTEGSSPLEAKAEYEVVINGDSVEFTLIKPEKPKDEYFFLFNP